MNEEKMRKLLRLLPLDMTSRLESWIVHTLLSAAERETDAKILDELERLAK